MFAEGPRLSKNSFLLSCYGTVASLKRPRLNNSEFPKSYLAPVDPNGRSSVPSCKFPKTLGFGEPVYRNW